MKGNHWVRYVRNMEAMLTGKEYGSAAPVWDQLAYGVFFQRMQTGPAEARSPEDIRRGRDALSCPLECARPAHCDCLGPGFAAHTLVARGSTDNPGA